MIYTWISAGDQDEKTCKICPLGPHILEHVEDGWEGDKMLMASNVYIWNSETNEYDDLETNIPIIEYKHNESYKIMEDWYACNVLSEKLFLGVDDVEDRRIQGK